MILRLWIGCHNPFQVILLYLVVLLYPDQSEQQQFPFTRPPESDPWNFGDKTTRKPGSPIDPNEVVVRINAGRIIGKKVTLKNLFWTPERDPREQDLTDRGPINPNPLPLKNDVTIYAFLGVPYALPPDHQRRFQGPQRVTRFKNEDATITAKNFGYACAQDITRKPTLWYKVPYEFDTNEDCLFLNVFTPSVSKTAGVRFPVMVFFHGGGFQFGSGNDWPAYVLSTKGIVVVTANYRLGPFGFMSRGSPDSGNYGLLDQRAVLEWVRDHIYEFSGDPGRVTLAGHGAGAVSAGLHMLSPGSHNLFHNVLAMSGADVSYHQVITKPGLAFNNTMKLARTVGCAQSTADEAWSCLLTRSTDDLIIAASSRNYRIEYNRYAFLPTAMSKFLPGAPVDMLRHKDVTSQVPMMTGVNKNDGTSVLLSDRSLQEFGWPVDPPYVKNKILDYIIRHNYTTNRDAIMESIEYQYTYWPETWNNEKVRDMYIQFGSDAYYNAPVSQSAQLHSSAGSFVYMYVNNYNFSRGALNPGTRFLPYWMGVSHECDLYLMFGFPWMPKEHLPLHLREVQWTDVDRNASEIFMAMVRQFVRESNPNLPQESTWINYSPRKHEYLDFNFSRTLKRDYNWQKVAFWNNYIPDLVGYFTTTYSPTVAYLRKEVVGYKAATGVILMLLLIMTTLAGVFAYKLFDRRQYRNRDSSYEAGQLHNETTIESRMDTYPSSEWPPTQPDDWPPRNGSYPKPPATKV